MNRSELDRIADGLFAIAEAIDRHGVSINRASESLSQDIRASFVSPNVPDSNLEASNLVDVLDRMANCVIHAGKRIAASDPNYKE